MGRGYGDAAPFLFQGQHGKLTGAIKVFMFKRTQVGDGRTSQIQGCIQTSLFASFAQAYFWRAALSKIGGQQ